MPRPAGRPYRAMLVLGAAGLGCAHGSSPDLDRSTERVALAEARLERSANVVDDDSRSCATKGRAAREARRAAEDACAAANAEVDLDLAERCDRARLRARQLSAQLSRECPELDG